MKAYLPPSLFAVVLILATAAIGNAQKEEYTAASIPPDELAKFLGPVSPSAFRWTKDVLIDFELYNGEAIPPLAGRVGFYRGGHPSFDPDPKSTKVKGRLGIFPVTWYRSIADDGNMMQQALVSLDDYWQIDIVFTAKQQPDIDKLVSVISELPLFTKRPEPIACSSPAELNINLWISYSLAGFAGLITLGLIFLNRRRNDFRWLPIYGTLLMLHPAWIVKVWSTDCGHRKVFFSAAVSILFLVLLACQLVWPHLRRRRILIILCGVCWTVFFVLFSCMQLLMSGHGGFLNSVEIYFFDASPLSFLLTVGLTVSLCFSLFVYWLANRVRLRRAPS